MSAVILTAAVFVSGCSGGSDKDSAPADSRRKASLAAAGDANEAVKTAGDAPNGLPPIASIGGKPPIEAMGGKLIYDKYCRYCHGNKGYGDGPVGIAITPRPADFVNDAKRMSKTDDELYKSISEGVRKDAGGEAMSMPGWQDILSEKERWDVLAYVRQLKKEGKKAGRP